MLCRQTHDVDTVQEREDVRGKNLPDKHPSERRPEQLETLVVCLAVVVERCGRAASARGFLRKYGGLLLD